jgi:sulfite exporter TauE/SafE
MTAVDLAIPLGFGLVSSLHCAQMCGPIVLASSLRGPRWRGQLAYNAGRIATYSALGALAGAFGQGMTWLGRFAGWQSAASLVAGAALVLAAVLLAGWIPSRRLVQIHPAPARWAARFLQAATVRARLALGLALGFLPCGMVYAALFKAVDTGSAWGGAATMCAFGLGTAVSLLAIGLGAAVLAPRLSRFAPLLAAASAAVAGVFLIYRGMTTMLPASGGHHHVHSG